MVIIRPWLLAPWLTVLACLPSASFKHRGPVEPAALDDGWEIAKPESVGIDPAILGQIHDRLLDEDHHPGALGLLVVKGGKLVFETYLRTPVDRDRHQHIQSATKSVTSIAVAIARARGLMPGLDTRLGQVFPEELVGLDPRKADITLADLLTMRSGLAFENEAFSIEMWVDKPARPLRHILSKPLFALPGERYDYRDADPQIVGYWLERATGQREAAFVRDNLFVPLGIEGELWESGADGVTMAAHGLHLKPRDLAKLGQLLLDDCHWGGQAIVPQDLCAEAISAKVAVTNHPSLPDLSYGQYFWVMPARGLFAAWGHGGQFIVVQPANDLILVQIAMPDAKLEGSRLEDFLELVAPLL